MQQLKFELRRWWTCVLLLATLSSTAQAGTPLDAFTAARRQWDASGIHDYTFTLVQHCFCPGLQPARITVKDDAVLSARNLRDGTDVAPNELSRLPGIAAIFQKISDGYARPAEEIRLRLNKEYGYPETVFIDYYKMMADDELVYEIRDFSR